MPIFDTHPSASHSSFPYYFDGTEGITWGTFSDSWVDLDGDLLIYYDSLEGSDFIDCRCSRWSTDNYTFSVETWLYKDDYQTLLDYITPGATGELFKILGKPTFYDQTWQGNNTIRIVPVSSSRYNNITDSFEGRNTSNLYNMRDPKIGYVKTITTSPIRGADGWMFVKLELNVSGSTI